MFKDSIAQILHSLTEQSFTWQSVNTIVQEEQILQNKLIHFFPPFALLLQNNTWHMKVIWLYHSCSVIQSCAKSFTRYQSRRKLSANFLSMQKPEESNIFPLQDRPHSLPVPHLTFSYSHIIIFSNELSTGRVMKQEIQYVWIWLDN